MYHVKIRTMIKLPENFKMPSLNDYNDVIQGMDDDIQEIGGAREFLGLIRSQRRSWMSFNGTMLMPAALHVLAMEEQDVDGSLRDQKHTIANIALAGMVFGHIANEALFPLMNQTVQPYLSIPIHTTLLDDVESAYRKVGGNTTPRGRQIGFSAMSAHILNQLNIDSVVSLNRWSLDIPDSMSGQNNFISGFGLALYAACDAYVHKMQQEGIQYDSTDVDSSL